MVVKNQRTVNRSRKKSGMATIEETSRKKDADVVIKGRSWMFASLLAVFGLFYLITSAVNGVPMNALYWFTGLSYVLLGVLIYLVRRPVISIGKNYITLRRFAGDKRIGSDSIEELTMNKGHIIIQVKNVKKKYIYTKLQHRFPMDELNAKLREFAVRERVPFKDET
ncbi:hypothetical protein DQG13_10255 [Paenibacillus sp. YN15]|nr:hypothetical protein DQG13_10255 [Paenibacillus sp. YN15]